MSATIPIRKMIHAKPPRTSGASENVIRSVLHAPDEEVEWRYEHGPEGRFVSGYAIKKKAKE